MTTFLQSVLNGFAQGSIYALLALGYVMIYKATHVISFAQPALMVCGGLFAYHATSEWGMSFWPALIVAVLLGALLGMLVERLALRPMVGKPVFTLAIITIGVDIVLRILANRYMGPDPRSVPYPSGSQRLEFWGLSISQQRLGLIVVTAVTVAALALFFRYAKTGLAMRATALNQETALAQGIRVGTMFALAWAIAGGLAAIAGTFVAATGAGMEQNTWIIALKALPAIIIGGLDSIPGAVIGGLAVGLVESITAVFQPDVAPWLGNNFALVAPYALMFLVLLVKPYGLFGTKEVERV
ncbi:branched-chain amino acid ABC transporter permease [Aeromicrobium sp. 636]|uniref:Branched-chain amino acid ABC transporter permease n=1 Tax=Aeromicrobium senzhongii TaxID=2663859 RepID=A0A8I0EVI4_9ACTN|nr:MULTISPECIES: branched-chain amino acid ABC transporter permease [Aeromicrobium]MBC9226934.1 branched-chain amino acid ABC transporter permease [Aeromicrobium senzhongii]MCQ3999034.1 branched-chain amino acid ABC transporter permease [Aeromicrobium sp. 636]MTB89459.1 branched-chain amino acid ABC transporter permease [Aeromicrobium senzhongii]QNL94404.1 branched-chain amino acid ABC transporter permease [Aeromicrobium senzhongii]